ncbi:MAG: patatin-like phospholipase family protein [Candidatus Moraniibacteriota bacterium]
MKQKMKKEKRKVTLILDAGGVKMGGAAIGVLRVLDEYYAEHGIEIDRLVAVSGGALAGAMYALGYDYSHISKTILHYWRRDLFDDFNPYFWNGFIRGDKIEAVIREVLQSAAFSQTKIPFSVLVSRIRLSSVEPVLINVGLIHHAVRASLSVPLYLQPKVWCGESYFDGKVSVTSVEDVIYAVKPETETHYVGIEGSGLSLFGLPIGIYNRLLKLHFPFASPDGYVPPLVRKIIVPVDSDESIWEGDVLSRYLLIGEQVARASVAEWE